MSDTVLTVYETNPATSMEDDDLIYFGRYPYTLIDDYAINFSDFSASIIASQFAWSGLALASKNADINNGYIIQNAAQTTIILPQTAPIGSIVSIRGLGAGGWILTAYAGQTIKASIVTTSSGGSIISANRYDTVDVICIVADTTWVISNPGMTTGFTYT